MLSRSAVAVRLEGDAMSLLAPKAVAMLLRPPPREAGCADGPLTQPRRPFPLLGFQRLVLASCIWSGLALGGRVPGWATLCSLSSFVLAVEY